MEVRRPETSELLLPFRDRRDAGRMLAASLHRYKDRPGTVVLALPRGGVVPAAEIADALGLPLDVIISRKLGAPGNPEYAMGAIAGENWLRQRGLPLLALGGVLTAAPLQRRETRQGTGLPVYSRQDLAQPKTALSLLSMPVKRRAAPAKRTARAAP